MTPEHCAAIMEFLPVVKAVAEGKPVYFAAFDCTGKFMGWRKSKTVNLGSLCAGYYMVKPRYQCLRPGDQPTEIPYPQQRFARKAK